MPGSRIEIARRHVADQEEAIALQMVAIDRMVQAGQDSWRAMEIVQEMETALDLMYAEVERLGAVIVRM